MMPRSVFGTPTAMSSRKTTPSVVICTAPASLSACAYSSTNSGLPPLFCSTSPTSRMGTSSVPRRSASSRVVSSSSSGASVCSTKLGRRRQGCPGAGRYVRMARMGARSGCSRMLRRIRKLARSALSTPSNAMTRGRNMAMRRPTREMTRRSALSRESPVSDSRVA
jgi:hypothetical protein